MSIWTSITGAVKSAVGAAVKSPLLKAIPGIGTVATAATLVGAVSKVARPAARAVKAIPGKGLIAAGATGAYLASGNGGQMVPAGYYVDQYGVIKKRRRMNYANGKAASRAVRRIKGTMKLLKRIEKQMPHKVVHRRS